MPHQYNLFAFSRPVFPSFPTVNFMVPIAKNVGKSCLFSLVCVTKKFIRFSDTPNFDIRLYVLFFFRLNDFTQLRKVKNPKFLVHQSTNIPRSLIDYSLRPSIPPKKQKKLGKKLAKQAFGLLLSYSNVEVSLPERASAGHQFLCLGYIEPLLRDEILLQLIKQTSGNPSFPNTVEIWRLMYLCVSHFTPSEALQPFFLAHLATYAHPTFKDPSVLEFMNLQDVATLCYLKYQELQGSVPTAICLKVDFDCIYIHGFFVKCLFAVRFYFLNSLHLSAHASF